MKSIFNRIKNTLNLRNIIMFSIIGVSVITIIFSTKNIKLNLSIRSLFPFNKKMERSASLAEKSPIADKVIIYIEVFDEKKLHDAIKEIDNTIKNSNLKFNNAIPGSDDINQIMDYSQINSLLLYPYEEKGNTFNDDEIKKRLASKLTYLQSLPFLNPSQGFFLDPLMMGFDILKEANETYKGKFTPMYGGVVSDKKKAYIKILKSGFFSEDYDKIKYLKELDDNIVNQSKKSNYYKAFLFSSHLFFWESQTTSKKEVSIIFIFTISIIIIIFYIFFKKLSLLIYSQVPIIAGLALTFLFISIFLKEFGGIALAFGATTAGIAIDYTINYLTRRNQYSSLKEVRKKIGLSLVLGVITTIAAFVLLPFSRIKSLQEISLFGILSISFSFLITWFVMQPLLKPDESKSDIRRINFKIPGKKSFLIWITINIILLLLLPFFKFEDNIFNLDMKHIELNKRLNLIKTNFNESSDSIFLVFEGNTKDEIFDKSLNALKIIHKENKNLTFFTPAIFYPSNKLIEQRKIYIKNNFKKEIFLKNLKNSDFSEDTFNDWLYNINNIDSLKILNIPDYIKEQIDSMIVEWNNKKYLMIPIYDRKISKNINSILLKNNADFFIVDIMQDSASGLLSFEKNALILLVLSIIIIFLILIIPYKKILYAICGILPGISGLLACLITTVITFRGFNIMHFVSSIMIMGIGVDYGIFVVSAYKDKFTPDEIKITFQSVFLSALTTIAGFGVLIFCKNYSIFSLGSSMFAGIIMSFLTTYMALPYLLKKANR